MAEFSHRFSQRTKWNLQPGDLSNAIAEARATGRDLIDLTVSNPTLCGFEYNVAGVFGPFSLEENERSALTYDPDPRGMPAARQAVTQYYKRHGAQVDADSLVLTTSTSEAYSYLFRLLCDPGDEVLVAQPSYPLFDFLAALDDIALKPYPLFYDYGWWIDFAELERRIGPRTRAVLVVHPNNPTGHWTHRGERERLEQLCVRNGLALIVDEVFLDYPIAVGTGDQAASSFAAGPHPALTFVLSGISKVAALPQMKVAWLTAVGPAKAVADALARLEVIADTFLSLNAPVQLALPTWLEHSPGMQFQIRERVGKNLGILRESGLEVLRLEAGWSAVLRLRRSRLDGDHSPAFELLKAGAILHPGDFYGIADADAIVLSLILQTGTFTEGVHRIAMRYRDEPRRLPPPASG